MRSLWIQIVAAAAGAAFLYLFYGTVRSSWPESYFRFDSSTDPIISRSVWKYLLYRIVPYFVVGVFISVTLDRAGEPSFLAVNGAALLHTVPRLVASYRSRFRVSRNAGHVLLRWTATLLALVGAVAGWAFSSILGSLVPKLPDLVAAAWTGLFAAVTGAALLRLSVIQQLDPATMIRRCRQEISEFLLEQMEAASAKYSVDSRLVMATVVVETAQRPGWVRRVEYLRGHHSRRGSGTYGVMQVSSPRPVTDSDSIVIACRDYFQGIGSVVKEVEWPTRLSGDPLSFQQVDYMKLRAALRTYNDSDDYIELVLVVLEELVNEERSSRISQAADRAKHSDRWSTLTGEIEMNLLFDTDPDSYSEFVSWLNGDIADALRDSIELNTVLARSRLGSRTSDGRAIHLAVVDQWEQVTVQIDAVAAIISELNFSSPPLPLSVPDVAFETSRPNSPSLIRKYERVFSLDKWNWNSNSPFVGLRVEFALDAELLWIGVTIGQFRLIAANVASDAATEGPTYDVRKLESRSVIKSLSDLRTDQIQLKAWITPMLMDCIPQLTDSIETSLQDPTL